MVNELESTIDFLKNEIKWLKRARKALPYETFNKNKCNNITKKIRRFEYMLEILQSIKKEDKND